MRSREEAWPAAASESDFCRCCPLSLEVGPRLGWVEAQWEGEGEGEGGGFCLTEICVVEGSGVGPFPSEGQGTDVGAADGGVEVGSALGEDDGSGVRAADGGVEVGCELGKCTSEGTEVGRAEVAGTGAADEGSGVGGELGFLHQ